MGKREEKETEGSEREGERKDSERTVREVWRKREKRVEGREGGKNWVKERTQNKREAWRTKGKGRRREREKPKLRESVSGNERICEVGNRERVKEEV